MKARLNIAEAQPAAMKAMLHLENSVRGLGLEPSLYELIKIRASQVNGCAYCIDMHTKDARAAGETEQRIYGLDAWRETPYYSDRERAALALAESITLITQGHVPDAVFQEAKKHFDEKELAAAIMACVAINAWNRIAITSRTEAGTYQPRH